jgi:hypothetical protein
MMHFACAEMIKGALSRLIHISPHTDIRRSFEDIALGQKRNQLTLLVFFDPSEHIRRSKSPLRRGLPPYSPIFSTNLSTETVDSLEKIRRILELALLAPKELLMRGAVGARIRARH